MPMCLVFVSAGQFKACSMRRRLRRFRSSRLPPKLLASAVLAIVATEILSATTFIRGKATMPLIRDRPDLNLRTVIYATDFSLCSQNAGLYAACLAKYFSATLLVAHAFTLSQAAMEVEVDHKLVSQQRKDLEFLLSRKAFNLASDSLETIPILLDGDPTEVLQEIADSRAPSLIVLGTHGGGWIERELIGSVAEHILRSIRWPSLTVGPQVPAHASAATFPLPADSLCD